MNINAPICLISDVILLYEMRSRHVFVIRFDVAVTGRLSLLLENPILLNVELIVMGEDNILVLATLLLQTEEHSVEWARVEVNFIREINADGRICLNRDLVRCLE